MIGIVISMVLATISWLWFASDISFGAWCFITMLCAGSGFYGQYIWEELSE
jgi:hypothetical protein